MTSTFFAILVVCSLTSPDRCTVLEDQRGPYATTEECRERVMEMHRQAVRRIGPRHRFTVACSPMPYDELRALMRGSNV